QALKAFWHALSSPPLDGVGVAHAQLMIRCLAESNLDSRIPRREDILKTLRQWLDGSVIAAFNALRPERIGKRFVKPEMDWLSTWLVQYPQISQRCGWVLPQPMVKALKDKDWEVQGAVIGALYQLVTTPEALRAVLKAAGDKNEYL